MSDTTNQTTAALATQTGVMPRHSLQLIGTAGSEDDRRALLRGAGGAIETVRVGDTVRQGTVVAISDRSLILNTMTGTRTLSIPTGPEPRVAA
ncbi:MAG: hypothetical protein AAF727_09295 [Pseudomonadota bacterium]